MANETNKLPVEIFSKIHLGPIADLYSTMAVFFELYRWNRIYIYVFTEGCERVCVQYVYDVWGAHKYLIGCTCKGLSILSVEGEGEGVGAMNRKVSQYLINTRKNQVQI